MQLARLLWSSRLQVQDVDKVPKDTFLAEVLVDDDATEGGPQNRERQECIKHAITIGEPCSGFIQ